MNIDWSKAPKGAEYYAPPTFTRYGIWYKKSGITYLECVEREENNEWDNSYLQQLPKEAIPCPTQQPPQWNGEGLPPVGTDVEYGYKSEFPTDWYKGKILAYYDGFVWILEGHDNEPCTFPISGMELRPIKSERDRQIDAIEAMIYRSECETTSAAERLYNAGCRIGGGE